MSEKPYYCYVLWSVQGQRFYIGVSDNIERRLKQHNAGASRWTHRFAGSWEVVWRRRFETLGEARAFESLLKRQKGGVGFFTLTGLPPPNRGS